MLSGLAGAKVDAFTIQSKFLDNKYSTILYQKTQNTLTMQVTIKKNTKKKKLWME